MKSWKKGLSAIVRTIPTPTNGCVFEGDTHDVPNRTSGGWNAEVSLCLSYRAPKCFGLRNGRNCRRQHNTWSVAAVLPQWSFSVLESNKIKQQDASVWC